MPTELQDRPLRAIVTAVQLPTVADIEFNESVNELRELAKTLGYEVVGSFVQKRGSFDAAAYVGAGKRQEIRRFVENRPEVEPESGIDSDSDLANPRAFADRKTAKNGPARAKDAARSGADPSTRRADLILVDHEISPSQARNLEIEAGCQVMDRTMVILEIFHRHARSPAARAQVEIARLGYMAPRLREAAKLAGPQGRQRSGIGGRGAGEAHSELGRQKIRNRIAELRLEIAAMDVERKTQRARRQEGLGLARISLIGYTNAGKSTLMRALTGNDALVADKLFATLDTTVRALEPQSVPRVLVSDTVGFIKNLPHDLVASFQSTLEEAAEASLLLHVIDASDPAFERQIAVTEAVLGEVDAQAVPRLRVFNKIDLAGDEAAQTERETELRKQFPECVVISARRPGDVAKLRAAVLAFFQRDLLEVEIVLPWSAQRLRGEIFANCVVVEERAEETGTWMRIRGEPATVSALREQFGQPIAPKPPSPPC